MDESGAAIAAPAPELAKGSVQNVAFCDEGTASFGIGALGREVHPGRPDASQTSKVGLARMERQQGVRDSKG